jgi:CheY-like chemotaxis protein
MSTQAASRSVALFSGRAGAEDRGVPAMTRPLVLVVEDDFLVRLNIAEILQEAGFEVMEAGEAVSALELLEENPEIRLVVTDIHMPGMLDGSDIVKRVRANYRNVGIIVMSSDNDNRSRFPGTPFLSKPFDAWRLINLAREACDAIKAFSAPELS